jgi:hypothetical protein
MSLGWGVRPEGADANFSLLIWAPTAPPASVFLQPVQGPLTGGALGRRQRKHSPATAKRNILDRTGF